MVDNTAEAALAALDAMTLVDMVALDTEQLRKFRELCRHWEQLADVELPKRAKPGSAR